MKKQQKNLPSLKRRPAGLSAKVVAAVRAKAGDNLTGAAIAAALESEGDEDEVGDISRAREFLASLSSVEPAHVWWALETRDIERRRAAELGVDEAQQVRQQRSQSVVEYLADRYVYAAKRDEVWDRRAKDWLSTKALSNSEAHRMPIDPRSDRGERLDALKVLRECADADRVHNERFLPGEYNEIVERDGVNWLNIWQRPSVEPAEGDAKPMLDHILYLCNGNREHAAHLANWLAYAYQHPGKKIAHAVLIISEHQGVGKDTLALAMSRLFGELNCSFIEDDAVSEGRNEFMKAAQLVVVPEIMCGDRRDIANKLKPLITQSRVRINEKHVPAYFADNVANFLFFSNHRNAAHIEDHDRRYFVMICGSAPRDADYYTSLYDYIQSDSLAGFAHFLATRDLSNFNPKERAPHTEHKDTVRAATTAGWEAWLDDAWQSDAAPFDKRVVNLREVLTAVQEAKGPRMTTQQVGEFLRKKGGGDLGRVRLDGGARVRLWAARDAEVYAADNALAAQAYERPTEHMATHLRVVAAE